MAVQMSDDEFEACVDAAIDQIPEELLAQIDNCVVLIDEDAPADAPDLLGLYDGIPLTERDSQYSGVLPDRIMIFRRNLKEFCSTREELIDEIAITVVHEIAHFFGIDDERLDELGYA